MWQRRHARWGWAAVARWQRRFSHAFYYYLLTNMQ